MEPRADAGAGHVRVETERYALTDAPDTDRWEATVREHPKGSVFHTPAMVAAFAGADRQHPLVVAAVDPSGEILALLVAVRVHTLSERLGRLTARSILYAEPLCRDDAAGHAALVAVVAEHDRRMCRRALFTEVRPLEAPGCERAVLERAGYRLEPYLNFLVRLQQPEEALWRAMKRPCREGIRRGERRGVTVDEETSPEGLEAACSLLHQVYEHARVPIADDSLFREAYRHLAPSRMRIFVARHEGRVIAAHLALLHGRRMFFWYGGSQRIPGLHAVECLTWHQLRWARENGYELYDFGGGGRPDKAYGVRDFKAKFGGEVVEYGRYTRVYMPRTLALVSAAYETRRGATKVLARLRAAPTRDDERTTGTPGAGSS